MHRSLHILMLALCSWLLWSCRGDEVVYPTIGTHITDVVGAGGLYVLCEGNMGSNKARLDYINLESGTYYSNWYGSQNPHQLKELGDVGNDLQQYGHRLYAVINCSHKVEVMDLQARHIAKIDIPNCRYITFYKDKAYVSAYVGSIADPDMLGSVFEIDTATLAITREIKVGHQPDELCIIDDLLYVCNSGGYLVDRYDSTLSVIDLNTFTEIDKIPVGLNPTRIQKDEQKRLWVCCQGDYKQTAPHLTIVENRRAIQRIQTPCTNLAIYGFTAYVLDNEHKRLRTYSTLDFSEQDSPFDIAQYEHPYGLLVTSDALYITDAKNYVSSGMLHCYSYDGRERWQAQTGDIPGHLCRVTEAYELYEDSSTVTGPSPYIAKVYEYRPAMGQFVNLLPKYETGDTEASMCRKCELALVNNAQGLVCLGGWGGYITFGFDHAVVNDNGPDLQILGNAYLMTGNSQYGSSEPGIVLVSRDDNGNGLPDDIWYELKGCLYDDPMTNHTYTKTYTRAGDTIQNPFHSQPYYPQWLTIDEYTLCGAKLPSQTQSISGQIVQHILEYGYVDNKPNNDTDGTSLDISWAVDADGNTICLPSIDFVRVYTAIDEINDPTGEISTEIAGAVDLHCTK